MLSVSGQSSAVVSSEAAVVLANAVVTKQVEYNNEAEQAAARRAAAQRKADNEASRQGSGRNGTKDVVSLSSKGKGVVGAVINAGSTASAKSSTGSKLDIRV